ncbi:anthranilate phosphoribosyltransferase family protein [Pleurocapsales cyanobacterium LEGE 06147]|nr:anthranilate phosphoribosyltransferase family protein [Pleurocapsales cyanobacterium LEGE 06147]
MSDRFRELLKKVGSGTHTSKDLSRQEAEAATSMMLLEEATPAQIGAFMIAHRIKRPTAPELTGMLDAYERIGPKLTTANLIGKKMPVVLGNPYDGRSRTVPVTPITALILAVVGVPVILHGGDCMPTKYGVPLITIWQQLGVDFSSFSLAQTQEFFEKTGVGFVYLPQHFPQAHHLVSYRDQIGKRPPFATIELIWTPLSEKAHAIAGFVHPPTENLFQETFKLRRVEYYTTVKGLEGSCELARSRTAIIGMGQPDTGFERLHLHPSDYDLGGPDVPLESTEQLMEQIQAVIQGKNTELMPSAILNGGFYLWRCGICPDLASGFARAETTITKGELAEKLRQLQNSCCLELLATNAATRK